MIDRQEIMDFAREFGLAPNVVEKDYVLGWLLAGVASHAGLGSSWVFKGGTCINKCFFETYRFSEDLDFTLTAAAHLNQDFLKRSFGSRRAKRRRSGALGVPHTLFNARSARRSSIAVPTTLP